MIGTTRWRPLIETVAAEYQPLDPVVFEAMVLIESNADPNARSASDARGLTQVIYRHHAALVDETAERFGVPPGPDALYDPRVSLFAGGRHLRWLYQDDDPGKRSWDRAVRAYFSGSYDPPPGFQDGQRTTPDQHITKLRAALVSVRADIADHEPTKEEPSMASTVGRVPMYGSVDKTYIAKNKREGVGWDNLGQRKPKFIAIHRMLGSLNSTESYFAPPTAPHLTDFAIGVASIDGKARAGEIDQYNDPLGFKSGWASGRVSKPYGDGKAIIDKYGINAVNRDGISMEISGHQTTPVDEVAWGELVWFCAYWCDWMKIPHTAIPTNPATGISAFIWHQEFTIGTGKECPFRWMMDNTNRLIRDTATFMKKYQEGTAASPTPTPTPEPKPVPAPAPLYKPAAPIAALIPFADDDVNAIPAAVKDANNEALEFAFVGDTVRLTKATPQFRYAGEKDVVGPDWPADTERYVPWKITLADKSVWYIDDQWRRIPRANTERVHDTKRAA